MKRKIKQTIIIMLVVILLLCYVPTSTIATASEANDFEYTILADGTAEITKYNGTSKDITIPEQIDGIAVTELGAYSLANLGTIENLTLPETFRDFGKDCFYGTQIKNKVIFLGTMMDWCTKIGYDWDNSQPLKDGAKLYINGKFIENLILPEGLTELRGRTFFAYKHLKNISFPTTLERIHAWAFIGCDGLETLIIPDNITRIDYGAFQLCKNLKKVYIGKGLKTVESDTFYLCSSINEVFYNGSKEDWNKISFGRLNGSLTNAKNFHFNFNPYNLGEETYSFKNFGGGYCFGMAVTSSGYHTGILDKSTIGLNKNQPLFSLSRTETVEAPIRYYMSIQGFVRDSAIVAGGTYNHTIGILYDIESDWKSIINYVKDHKHNELGDLVIGFGTKDGGGHAVNFLRYEVVDGQERIYIYDNNCPHSETYFYKDNSTGKIYEKTDFCNQGCSAVFKQIDYMSLVDVEKYIKAVETFNSLKAFYADAKSIFIERAYVTTMWWSELESSEHYMYEILDDSTEIIITPLVDNATFMYMDKEYSFGKIDEDTYAEFSLSTSEDEAPEFEIVNAPEEDPSESCSCNCHASGIKKIFFIIINFFQKLFGKNKVCACGVSH